MSGDRLRRLWTDPEQRRWLAFAALAATYGLVSIYRLSTAVLADELTRAFSVTGTQLGTLHASFFYVYAAMQLPAGVLADRLGSRRTVTAGALVMSLGGLVFAAADSYALAFVGRALVGLGGSVLFVAILRFSANWFRPTEFARMNGITIAVAGVGGILATTPLAVAVAVAGWRETVAALSLVGVALAVGAYLVARDSPSAAGFDPIADVDTPGSPSLRGVISNARRVLGELETWLCGAVLFAGTGVNLTVIGLWGIPYLVESYGLSVTVASTYTLLASVGLLVGPPATGFVSDRLAARRSVRRSDRRSDRRSGGRSEGSTATTRGIGSAGGERSGADAAMTASRTRLVVWGMAVYTVAFGVLAATGVPPLFVVAVVFLASGVLTGTFVLTYAVVKERHDATASGVSTGTINMMAFSGAAVLPTLMGYALDAYWTGETVGGVRVYSEFGYQVAFGIATAIAFLSLLAAMWLHRRTVRATDAS